jgi:hypothetical protein
MNHRPPPRPRSGSRPQMHAGVGAPLIVIQFRHLLSPNFALIFRSVRSDYLPCEKMQIQNSGEEIPG